MRVRTAGICFTARRSVRQVEEEASITTPPPWTTVSSSRDRRTLAVDGPFSFHDPSV